MPMRWAARTFSLTPPTGRTFPRRVISPVMATSQRTLALVHREMKAVAMVTPADGPVLGDGPLRDVDVEIVLLEEAVVDAELPGVGPGIAQGGLGGFLHDVAQGAGQGEVPLPLHLRRFDEQDLAAGLGPGDARGDADLVLAEELVLEDLGRAEERLDVLGGDPGQGLPALGDLAGDLPADGGDLALQVPDARLAGVEGDDLPDRPVGDVDELGAQGVLGDLLRDEVLLGDLELLLLRVAGEGRGPPSGRGRRAGWGRGGWPW